MRDIIMQKNNFSLHYIQQVELLLQLLPIVAKQTCFALKGGTALNLFIRELPRLSIDIDITYLPLKERSASLEDIEHSLLAIKHEILKRFPHIIIEEKRNNLVGRLQKLIVGQKEKIKIEPNEILRGALYPIEYHDLSKTVTEIFEQTVLNIPTLSLAELYAGKICAALDRQHPRDLFDIQLLHQNEGLSDAIRQALTIYVACSPRPIHELLNPTVLDQNHIFYNEFQGMTMISVKYDELIATLNQLIHDLKTQLTLNERQFLISVKQGEPDYELMPFKNLAAFPALRWKIMNVRLMDKHKQALMLDKLKKVLAL